MKRWIQGLALLAATFVFGACNLPLGTGAAESCFRQDGFLGQEMTEVSCAGPHDFSTAERASE